MPYTIKLCNWQSWNSKPKVLLTISSIYHPLEKFKRIKNTLISHQTAITKQMKILSSFPNNLSVQFTSFIGNSLTVSSLQ